MIRYLAGALLLALAPLAINAGEAPGGQNSFKFYDGLRKGYVTMEKVVKSDAEWKNQLSPQAYDVLRKKGTERAFSGIYDQHKGDGIYVCAGCGNHLFDSVDKYDSGTGWPSFVRPIDPVNVGTEIDRSFFSTRIEVHCARCGGHLGHVFDDGPAPTFKRYCMNSVSLNFLPRAAK